MSLEPGRTAPYSVDIRWRIVWLRVKGLSFSEIGRHLQIAPSTAHRVFSHFLITGEVEPKVKRGPRRHMRKLDVSLELFIIGLILEAPSMYLHELCMKVKEISGIEVCASTICNLLHKHGFTRKKNQASSLAAVDGSERGIYCQLSTL